MEAPVPELFLPHLPQHFQDPDSPNLHMLQRHDSSRSTQKPTARSQTARSTLRALRIPTGTTPSDPSDASFHPTRVSALEDLIKNDRRNIQGTHLRPQTTAPPQQDTTPVSSGAPLLSSGGSDIADALRPSPSISPGGTVAGTGHDQNFKPMTGIAEGSTVTSHPRSRGQGRSMTTARPTTTTTASEKLGPGYLKLPGHEPEAPADIVLVHHDRAIDTRNQSGLNGIYVKDESTDVTPEGESLYFVSVSFSSTFKTFASGNM